MPRKPLRVKKRTTRKVRRTKTITKSPGKIKGSATARTKATPAKKTNIVANVTTSKTTGQTKKKRSVTSVDKKKPSAIGVSKTAVKGKASKPTRSTPKSKKEKRQTKKVLRAMDTKTKTKSKVKEKKRSSKVVEKKKVVVGHGLKRTVKKSPTVRDKTPYKKKGRKGKKASPKKGKRRYAKF